MKQNTSLKNARVFIEFFRPRLEKYFLNIINTPIDYFPKEDYDYFEFKNSKKITPANLKLRSGCGISLPFGTNPKLNHRAEIISGNPFKIVEPIDILPICKAIKSIVSIQTSIKYNVSQKFFDSEDKRESMLQEPIRFYYRHPTFKLCLKAIIDGTFQARGKSGFVMKVHFVNELYKHRAPISTILKGLSNQEGFNIDEAHDFILNCIAGVNYNKTPSTLRCTTVRKLGFCLENCHRIKKSEEYRKGRYDMEKLESVDGWDGLHALNNNVVNRTEKRYYYYKTTRSGTTTSVIIKALEHKKKILMIAPLLNIFKITVKEAIKKGHELGFLGEYDRYFTYRVKSNIESCSVIKETYGDVEGISNVFPFLYKADCKTCSAKTKHNCEHDNFLNDMDGYDLIYLTVKKFNALIKGGENAKIMMDKLLSWSDIIFVDECSHIFDVEWDSMQIFEENQGNAFNETMRWKSSLDTFLKEFPTWLNKHSIITLEKFIKKVSDSLNDILLEDESLFINFKNEFFDDLNVKQSVELYIQFINYYTTTLDPGIKPLIDCFLLMNRPMIYLQLILPNKDPRKVFLASVSDIMNMVNFLNNNTKNKLLLLTDATAPPVALDKCFDNLEFLNVNDPMNTAAKQTIYILPSPLSIKFQNAELKEKIIEIMDKYTTNKSYPVFVVGQSIKIMSFILKLARENRNNNGQRWHIGKMDYFRGKSTRGTPSPFRKMLVFGSSHPPRHCYDYVAAIYRKVGFLSTYRNAEVAGKYLEQYSAQSAFFQTISRSKCPEGREESSVLVYDVKISEVRNWLKMKINTPKVVQL